MNCVAKWVYAPGTLFICKFSNKEVASSTIIDNGQQANLVILPGLWRSLTSSTVLSRAEVEAFGYTMYNL